MQKQRNSPQKASLIELFSDEKERTTEEIRLALKLKKSKNMTSMLSAFKARMLYDKHDLHIRCKTLPGKAHGRVWWGEWRKS